MEELPTFAGIVSRLAAANEAADAGFRISPEDLATAKRAVAAVAERRDRPVPPLHPDLFALMNGVRDEPHSRLRRLVVADWYEEHGQEARAEYIRLANHWGFPDGWAENPTEESNAAVAAAKKRRRELEATRRDEWVPGGIASPLPATRFHLGFAQVLHCSLAEWERFGPYTAATNVLARVNIDPRSIFTYDPTPRYSTIVTGFRPLPDGWLSWLLIRQIYGTPVSWPEAVEREAGGRPGPAARLLNEVRLTGRPEDLKLISKCAISWALWRAAETVAR